MLRYEILIARISARRLATSRAEPQYIIGSAIDNERDAMRCDAMFCADAMPIEAKYHLRVQSVM